MANPENDTTRPVEQVRAGSVFDLCKDERLGARAIAMWLNERSYRTRTGRPWGHKTVLDMLRNPIYVGDVAFRGAVHPGGHPGIVDRPTFEACAALLDARVKTTASRRAIHMTTCSRA